MTRSPRWILLAVLAAVLSVTVGVVASSGKSPGRSEDSATTTITTTTTTTTPDDKGGKGNKGGKNKSGGGKKGSVYTIPGDTVFPEGIALDKSGPGKSFFVSSTTDGTIFKGNVKGTTLAPFAAGGADGRTSATGLTVNRGRLFVSGAGTGKAFVLSTADGSTLKVLDTKPGSTPTFINDVTVGGGYAYFTDSQRPIIWRASTSGDTVGDIEPWLDLNGTPFVYQSGFNANGIVNFDGGRLLVVVQSNTGKLFRIATQTKDVREIDLGGKTLVNGDGLVAHGSRLYVVQNTNQISTVKLRRDRRQGQVTKVLKSDLFAFPTTAARNGSRLLVVNAQFDKRGPGLTPVLPFTVASVRKP
jgi:Cu-Zn family superoxide dismutase